MKKTTILLLVLGITVSLATGCVRYYKNNIGIYNKWVKQLDDDINYRGTKDLAFDQLVVEHIQEKQDDGKALTDIEQFIMGYHAYFSEDYERALSYYEPISKHQIKDKRQLINTLLLKHMNRIYVALQMDDKALELTTYWLDHLPNKTYRTQGGLVIYAVLELGNKHGNSEFINQSLEKILENKGSYMSVDDKFFLLSTIGNNYLAKGNYGRGFEVFLEGLALAQSMNTVENIVLFEANIGVIYQALGNFEESLKWYERALNEETNAITILNKAIVTLNCIQTMIMQDQLVEAKEMLEQYEDNYANIESEQYATPIEITYKTILANYYLACNELEKAQKIIEPLLSCIADEKDKYMPFIDTNFYMLLGEYYMLSDQPEEAISYYLAILDQDASWATYESAKILLAYYEKKADLNNIKKYTDLVNEISEEIIEMTNNNYVSYAEQKYRYEVALNQMHRAKLKHLIVSVSGMMGLLIICSFLFYKLRLTSQINKKDGLTQIYNRGYFNKEYEMINTREIPYYMIIFDIDNFKMINDTYGHIFGDYIIKNIAQITASHLGKVGRVYRYGGEEFVILIKDATEQQVIEVAETIRQAVESFKWEKGCKVTISMGISHNAPHIKDVLSVADQELYAAKRNGKNRISYQV